MEGRKINIMKVTGLGTDGASVMTGRKEGLTGQFLKNNPHVINTHCSAHRLALCSEQAAENVPGMKYYQGVLEALFYYFKKSPLRNDSLLAVQKLLDEPQVKCREVHQVRWLSFYDALDAIYRTMDSLLSFFSTATDPTKDIDIGSVQAVVDTKSCLRDLEGMWTEDDQPAPTSFRHQLQDHLKDGIYKGTHTITKSHYSHKKTRVDFIKALIDNITKRFPDKQLMTSMCILGMRPITFLSEEELESWGNESLEVLLDHFGNPKSHTFKNELGEVITTDSQAIVGKGESRLEWRKLKQVVKIQGYPRHSTAVLWRLIKQYHSEDFPNMLTLAAHALTHPVHTSDCERAFSAQNLITSPLRNRLSSDHCDQLMRIMIQGPKDFNFIKALKIWREAKHRAIFN